MRSGRTELSQMVERAKWRIECHWDDIATYCHADNRVSLVYGERLTNKIRVLQRRAHGLRDEDCLRLTILTGSLPPL